MAKYELTVDVGLAVKTPTPVAPKATETVSDTSVPDESFLKPEPVDDGLYVVIAGVALI